MCFNISYILAMLVLQSSCGITNEYRLYSVFTTK